MEDEIATSGGGPPIRRIALATAADVRADYVMAAYDEHQRRLTSFAYALTRDADAADDLVQEAFLRLIKQHAAGNPPDNVLAWLYRVCSNLATSRGRRGVVARRFVQHAPPPADEVAAEVEVLRRDTGEALVAALGSSRTTPRPLWSWPPTAIPGARSPTPWGARRPRRGR